MLLAQNHLMPMKLQGSMYLMNIRGEVADQEVMQAVLNGMDIDTSASIDSATN
jgi:hypothetical protein